MEYGTWAHIDSEFLFECSTQDLMSKCNDQLKYRGTPMNGHLIITATFLSQQNVHKKILGYADTFILLC